MNRFLVFVLLIAVTALGAENSVPSVGAGPSSSVTFNKDVLPILQKNCQVCHRPGEVAPMSFMVTPIQSAVAPITVVVNWAAGLDKK